MILSLTAINAHIHCPLHSVCGGIRWMFHINVKEFSRPYSSKWHTRKTKSTHEIGPSGWSHPKLRCRRYFRSWLLALIAYQSYVFAKFAFVLFTRDDHKIWSAKIENIQKECISMWKRVYSFRSVPVSLAFTDWHCCTQFLNRRHIFLILSPLPGSRIDNTVLAMCFWQSANEYKTGAKLQLTHKFAI